jgi:radical SAM superfamily enzyme YgiQ (UPF0313 family)
MKTTYIDPLRDLGALLLRVEKPARYTGGEYGSLAGREAEFRTAVAFPDLYEIGMSNQAFRILYNALNRINGVSCDRAFAPAPDFEALLRERRIPLYGLDTGIALGDLDMLFFTLGYELGITGVLAMLDAAFLPLRSAGRKDGPLVVMGGPCVSNPLPYARFIDAFWIGEAEAGFFELIREAAALKKTGAGREELLALLRSHPSVWAEGKKKAVRAIDRHFGSRGAAVFPVPSIKVVQHHGAVEIMRGCPHGCRFCHAGIWYRPMRQKNADIVLAEAEAFIQTGGYREISLSSLSSGDYCRINALVESLNRRYASRHISFQLPSLRVSTFSLPLLEKISKVRKSGLTFAVETPVDAWQLSINKEVSGTTVKAILNEAKKHGWRGAKFYFMVGLPVGAYTRGHNNHEESAIVDFITDIARETKMRFSVNAGTFIPKPHTPYQWMPQIDEETARAKLDFIRNALKGQGHKIGVQDPFISTIEGVLSRGDERVGELIEEAYGLGCRFDAWSEYLKKDLWRGLFKKNDSLVTMIMGEKNPGRPLPWGFIEPGTALSYLRDQWSFSNTEEFTSPCTKNCNNPCGICSGGEEIVLNSIHDDISLMPPGGNPGTPPALPGIPENKGKQDPPTHRLLFSFSKEGRAVFLPHLGVVEVFSMALVRSGFSVLFSSGFNPLPKLSFAAPLAMGIRGCAEIAAVDMEEPVEPGVFIETINPFLPEGFVVLDGLYRYIPRGIKRRSLTSILWGFTYEADGESGPRSDHVPAREEKAYRLKRTGSETLFFGLTRSSVLALNGDNRPDSFFSVYRDLYRQ